MVMDNITINNEKIQMQASDSILQTALKAEIYIPHLCHHPDLTPLEETEGVSKVFQGKNEFKGTPKGDIINCHEGCRLCIVDIEGVGLTPACSTLVESGMVIQTDTPEIKEYRGRRLARILETHPHACLTCAQREGCAREPCSSNVPIDERCCPLLGNCELEKICDYVGIPNYTPKYIPQHKEIIDHDPIILRNYELCIGCTRCVRACSELRGVSVLGYTYLNGQRIIGILENPYLIDTNCRFCGACIEVCPTGALTDKGISIEKSYEEIIVPCKHTCPLATDVPQYIRYIHNKQYDKAVAVILERTPFPSVLGRVCFHPCEQECRRNEVNEPIAICSLKRFATDMNKTAWEQYIPNDPPTGKKIAVIGAGPTGLTAAYFLTRKGHDVTVFEEKDEIGGLLRTALPNYRLPNNILEKDLNFIRATGMKIHLGVSVGKDVHISEMLSNGFSSVFVAIGAQLSKKLDIVGSDLNNIHWGIELLKAVKNGNTPSLGQNVVVIGGGGVAIDVALTLKRLGLTKVQLICLESRLEMPANEWEIEEAIEEGIAINCSWGPKEILQEKGKVTGIELIQCTSVFDETLNFAPQFNDEVTKIIEADSLVFAIGQTADLQNLDLPELDITPWNTIKINERSMATSIQGVFAGGEVVSGPSSVVDAIHNGTEAAISIDKYLGGNGNIFIPLIEHDEKPARIGKVENFAALPRTQMLKTQIHDRIITFDEIELGFSLEEAIEEAGRCLQCDLRLEISSVNYPPKPWLELEIEQIMKVPNKGGVIQLLDEKKDIFLIQGALSLRQTLLELSKVHNDAHYFIYEEEEMYTKRESELLQQYLQVHNGLPRGNESELDDDLF
jgi:NADPH-dependent glutamate synthase beta subunit-like oxidoreductase/NAD-dependent dihydropyrimidine dehydrogenase PreA subunit